MSYHFMAHTKRMEQAGIFSVRLTLGGLDAKGNRLMVVSPHENLPPELAVKFPPRVFEIDGTDRLLDQLTEDMAYTGATPEKLVAAIAKHPLARADLLQWYADWMLSEAATEDDVAEAAEPSAADVERSLQFVKGLLRGHDSHRKSEARKP